ncbi:MAG: hypothetical protein AB7R89_26820 [Dehalococcoidia bacterium]
MTPVLLHTDLPRKLLIVIGSAHTAGASPPDWSDCAVVTDVRASPRSVNRALSHLAEAGLIEGVMTEDGWISLRPTPRGLAQAGKHLRPYHPGANITALPASVAKRSAAERFSATVDEVSREFRTISLYTGATWLRTREAMSPRLTAVRATVAETWHMFTTFP